VFTANSEEVFIVFRIASIAALTVVLALGLAPYAQPFQGRRLFM
jgi:hypothetical protein